MVIPTIYVSSRHLLILCMSFLASGDGSGSVQLPQASKGRRHQRTDEVFPLRNAQPAAPPHGRIRVPDREEKGRRVLRRHRGQGHQQGGWAI
jgi:hypothetical protein